MKNVYRIFLTAALMVGIVSTNAQNRQPNRCTIGNEHYSITVESPANTIINKVSDNIITSFSLPNINNTVRANAETHLLSIKPNGHWDMIEVSGPNGYFNYIPSGESDGFEEEVEDGTYNAFVLMYDQDWCYLVYDIVVNQDITMTPTTNEACYTIYIDPKDENGNPIKNYSYSIIDNFTEVYLFHGLGNANFMYEVPYGFSENIPMRFNSLSASNTISVTQRVSIENQTTYFINYPIHLGQLNGDLELTTEPSEMQTYLARFNMHNQESAIYNIDYFKFFVSETSDVYTPFNQYGWFEDNKYNPAEPIRLITNNKIDDSAICYDNGYTAVKPFVTAFETLDPEDYSGYYDKIAANAIFYTDNQWVNEPIDAMPFVWSGKALDYFDPFTPTPSARYTDIGQTCYFGERTPFLYWQAENFGPTASFGGDTYIGGPMEFIGENGCIRTGDECAKMIVNANGEEIYNDSIYKFNLDGYISISELCAIEMRITDKHLVVEDVEKGNYTTINFDFTREDAMPPTMTMLRVMNEYGQENVLQPNVSNTSITFAAGDFEPRDAGGWFDKMLYKAKPSVEVFYAVANGDWMPLECTENEDLFHVNYGNVFTIDLSQLDASVLNQWVSLKFVVTDEAGNSQTQELSNVFFAGQQTSVNEQTTALAHSVYPNPFSGEVRINAVEAVNGNANVSVFNVLGEQVISRAMQCNGTTEFVIDGSSLNAGIYFYSIATENGKLQGRIVKE